MTPTCAMCKKRVTASELDKMWSEGVYPLWNEEIQSYVVFNFRDRPAKMPTLSMICDACAVVNEL